MKYKILIIIIILSMFSINSFSQSLKNIGLKIAVNSSDQSFKYTELPELETNRRIGMDVGVFFEWFGDSYFSLLTELEYNQRGMEYEYYLTNTESPDVLGSQTDNNRIDILSLPVLARFKLDFEKFNPYIIIGPRIDYIIGYNTKYFNLIYDNFKKFIPGGIVGLGTEISIIPSWVLLAEIRYNLDFSYAYNTDMLKVKNNAFDLMIGFNF